MQFIFRPIVPKNQNLSPHNLLGNRTNLY